MLKVPFCPKIPKRVSSLSNVKEKSVKRCIFSCCLEESKKRIEYYEEYYEEYYDEYVEYYR